MSDATAVLFIDDDAQYRDYCAQRLHTSALNFDAVHAATGRSGLNICARQPIDCVMLEIDLPDMSGFEVLAKLVPRPHRPEIAVIVLTRLSNKFLLDLAIKNGAQAAFYKTVGIGELLERSILDAMSTVQVLNRLVS
jgi:two-component system KDP operon response regulator KdpE